MATADLTGSLKKRVSYRRALTDPGQRISVRFDVLTYSNHTDLPAVLAAPLGLPFSKYVPSANFTRLIEHAFVPDGSAFYNAM